MESDMKHALFTIAALALLITSTPAQAGTGSTWVVDKSHSSVGFVARHLMISKVKGSFGAFDGTVEADAEGRLASLEGSIDVTSIDTGNEKRDGHLKAPDFFDAAKHPKMTFASTAIKFDGQSVKVVGTLTLKGVSKAITLKGEFLGTRKANFGHGDQLHGGYSFTGRINRQEFGLTFNGMAEGTKMVSDLIDLELDLEIILPQK
jgi:polyisoprenoid-binding protein YceI